MASAVIFAGRADKPKYSSFGAIAVTPPNFKEPLIIIFQGAVDNHLWFWALRQSPNLNVAVYSQYSN
ncbi:MAG: hypothetical protein LBP22_00725 [Deltaproteobacteria bacterium]|jgi:hypothetical protein|nr:hypothetical protein [Deltaproteobacteria bacterium]